MDRDVSYANLGIPNLKKKKEEILQSGKLQPT